MEKKLRKGDGGWNQWKEILGWVLDSECMMLELTEWHAKQIIDIFNNLQGRKCVGVKKWQQVLGNSGSWDRQRWARRASLVPSSWGSPTQTSTESRSLDSSAITSPTLRPWLGTSPSDRCSWQRWYRTIPL